LPPPATDTHCTFTITAGGSVFSPSNRLLGRKKTAQELLSGNTGRLKAFAF